MDGAVDKVEAVIEAAGHKSTTSNSVHSNITRQAAYSCLVRFTLDLSYTVRSSLAAPLAEPIGSTQPFAVAALSCGRAR